MARRLTLPMLDPDPAAPFPAAASALAEPPGLLAFGGDLSPTRLLNAYRHGIFPWFSRGEPLLWWSPDPRMVIAPDRLTLSRRDRRSLRSRDWRIVADHDFAAVLSHCAAVPRPGQRGTWITAEMQAAYIELHRLGHAHSVEVHAGARLVGGIYGVAIGRAFFGESMFGIETGASKAAIAALARQLADWGFDLLDGQVESAHLARLGFAPVPRPTFLARCATACAQPAPDWTTFATIDAGALSRMLETAAATRP